MTIKTPRLAPALRSQLTMLDRGAETSQALKQRIAEYLGVPVGTKLSLLRKADDNVKLTERALEEYNATWGHTERNNDDNNNNNNNVDNSNNKQQQRRQYRSHGLSEFSSNCPSTSYQCRIDEC
ncbi:hypothetical protein IV203_017562 [Nitzschia inconspicua]|uniref:Uncharacterized protein n=1 Tax=Nitzschia inconspicua TaxID=303405 RepID=A0A9K3K4P5_9STRA|nr:hypothetical protein IV203_017562 [Nitzschia inconspicua]